MSGVPYMPVTEPIRKIVRAHQILFPDKKAFQWVNLLFCLVVMAIIGSMFI